MNTEPWIVRPSPVLDRVRFEAFIESPDGEAHAIFAYHNDAIRWIARWYIDRGLPIPPIETYGPADDGGVYTIAPEVARGIVANATS